MTFKDKLAIHDEMMTLHGQFTETAKEARGNQPAEQQEKITTLENLMKSICQLVDKALDMESAQK